MGASRNLTVLTRVSPNHSLKIPITGGSVSMITTNDKFISLQHSEMRGKRPHPLQSTRLNWGKTKEQRRGLLYLETNTCRQTTPHKPCLWWSISKRRRSKSLSLGWNAQILPTLTTLKKFSLSPYFSKDHWAVAAWKARNSQRSLKAARKSWATTPTASSETSLCVRYANEKARRDNASPLLRVVRGRS